MTAYGALLRPLGRSSKKIAAVTASITGTGNIDTGLSTVEYAVACVINSGTTVPTDSASISAISGGTVSVVVTNHAAAANSIETAAKNVTVIAVGY